MSNISQLDEPQTPDDQYRADPPNWIERLATVSEHYVPDALTSAIFMMVVLAASALMLGNTVEETVDAYYRGLWMLLQFTMQMTLMLTLSLVLADTPVFKNGVIAVSRLPRTASQVVVGAVVVTALISYVNWGLSIALSPLVAIHYCKQADQKGIPVDFNWMLAVLAGVGSIWQFGLSASAPLQMTATNHFLVDRTPPMPLATTIWSPAAIAMVILFLVTTTVVGILFMPTKVKPISAFPESNNLAEAAITGELNTRVDVIENHTLAQKMERTSFTLVPLWIALAAWLFHHFFTKKASLDINSMITILLLSCLLLHRTIDRFTTALKRVLASTWPIVVLYHIYAGVAGLIQFTVVGDAITRAVEPFASEYTLPLLTATVSTVVAVFIPTSGGQWAIQGAVTISTAEAAGITPQRNLLALSVGDHMGNLISPFWAVVGAGIVHVDFRQIFGYRLIFAAIWFTLGVLIFTFLPC
jgi:short-chain fatty acids transporter